MAPAQMLAIREWVDGVKFMGEFQLESAADILAAVAELQLDAVQLGMVAAPETVAALIPETSVFLELIPDYYHTQDDLQDMFTAAPKGLAAILLNLEKNGFTWADIRSGQPFPLATLQQLCRDYPVFLALNFQTEEVEELLASLPVQGLQLRGGAEEKVGIKSFDELDDILDLLEIE